MLESLACRCPCRLAAACSMASWKCWASEVRWKRSRYDGPWANWWFNGLLRITSTKWRFSWTYKAIPPIKIVLVWVNSIKTITCGRCSIAVFDYRRLRLVKKGSIYLSIHLSIYIYMVAVLFVIIPMMPFARRMAVRVELLDDPGDELARNF